jgi:hypothetical protein
MRVNSRQTVAFLAVSFSLLYASQVSAQQYKIRQGTSVMGMKTESTIYVKGMRKRTEAAGYMGQPGLTTIEQCDKQRTITLNDRSKLYFIEPFAKDEEEVIDDDAKLPAKKTTPVKTDKGGLITMWYNIIDTGERKKMYGFTARHIWTNQKMKPSADACTMKDSLMIKTDGWYIDFPEFNCPIRYATKPMNASYTKPDCLDKFVTHRSGKGRLGFPLVVKTTMMMGDGSGKTTEFTTELETVELSTARLDSMLFEIPPGYTEAKSLNDLQEKVDYKAMIKDYTNKAKENAGAVNTGITTENDGRILIGVYAPTGDDNIASQAGGLQQYIVENIGNGAYRSIAVSSEQDAKDKKCTYTLGTAFSRFKQASKIGGLLKAVKNTDPNAASSYNIDAALTLTKLADGSVKATEKVSGKYDGRPDDASKRAVQEGCMKIIEDLK